MKGGQIRIRRHLVVVTVSSEVLVRLYKGIKDNES